MEDNNESKVILEIKDLYKSYGDKEVLKGLSLEVHEGEVFGLIGKNGIGKSTTIDCLVGSKTFNSGDITIDGCSITKEPLLAKKKIGYVSSEPCLYEIMTGREYLTFIGSIYNLNQNIFENNLKILLKKFNLTEEDLEYKTGTYSHGMKQKLCLIASLIHNPKVWVLDEPTVGLDVMVYKNLVGVMREFASHGRTVFVTSHNLDMVSQICDRVAIVNNGVVCKLIDLKKEPYLRMKLSKIFFDTYGENQ